MAVCGPVGPPERGFGIRLCAATDRLCPHRHAIPQPEPLAARQGARRRRRPDRDMRLIATGDAVPVMIPSVIRDAPAGAPKWPAEVATQDLLDEGANRILMWCLRLPTYASSTMQILVIAPRSRARHAGRHRRWHRAGRAIAIKRLRHAIHHDRKHALLHARPLRVLISDPQASSFARRRRGAGRLA